jgi:hypothetical protein
VRRLPRSRWCVERVLESVQTPALRSPQDRPAHTTHHNYITGRIVPNIKPIRSPTHDQEALYRTRRRLTGQVDRNDSEHGRHISAFFTVFLLETSSHSLCLATPNPNTIPSPTHIQTTPTTRYRRIRDDVSASPPAARHPGQGLTGGSSSNRAGH